MLIHYKELKNERVEDAPFMGALLCAIDCHFSCEGCFNQEVKDYETQTKDSLEIIKEIKSDPFNKGIILAGLEWTCQENEMRELIDLSLQNGLKVMLYTGYDEEKFKERFTSVYYSPIYIKFGRYRQDLKTSNNIQYGVRLATLNQKITYDR